MFRIKSGKQKREIQVKTKDGEFNIFIRDPKRSLYFMKGTPYDNIGQKITLRKPAKEAYSLKKKYTISVKQTMSLENCAEYDENYTFADCLQVGELHLC